MASSDSKVALIGSVSLFKGLSRKELEQIAQLVDDVDIPAGKVLVRQGENGAEMFIIATGSVRIERNGEFIRDAGPGTAIGEMALLSEGPRTATVTTNEPTRILLAGHREFHQLMEEHPTIRLAILGGLASKIRMLDEAEAH
ncbi:MAG: cyclic nucleotide-binding domain-containing protein [Chloroflexi bacterium]|nr:cyclic nucleotide-binding domain-containing protein [Chloroflexota bacterium]